MPGVLSVRLPGAGLLLAEATEDGATIDTLLVERAPLDGRDTVTSLVQVEGIEPIRLLGLAEDLQRRYGAVEVLERSPEARLWLLRVRMPVDRVASPALRFLLRFQAEFDAPWSRFEAGWLRLRAAPRGEAPTEADLERMRAGLRKLGVPGEVALEPLREADVAAWSSLAASAARHGVAWGMAAAPQPEALARLQRLAVAPPAPEP